MIYNHYESSGIKSFSNEVVFCNTANYPLCYMNYTAIDRQVIIGLELR